MNATFIACMASNTEYITEALENVQFTHAYWIFLAPLLMEALDIITGWVQATINRTWDSTKMRYGLLRKSAMMAIVIVAYLFEYAIEGVAHIHLASCAAAYVIFMEALSVVENLDLAGIWIPKFVRDHLGKVKKEIDGESAGGTEA